MKQRVLVLFMFETGDASCRFYDVPLIVYSPVSTTELQRKLQHAVSDALNDLTDDGEGFEYEDACNSAVVRLGLRWESPSYPISRIENVVTVLA